MPEQATLSDYQAVGGGPAVKAVVDDFYERVLHDPQLAGTSSASTCPGSSAIRP